VSEATLDGLRVAVKQTPADNEYAARVMKCELEVLTRLSHPHIVQLLGVAEHAGRSEVWSTARCTRCCSRAGTPS